MHRIKSEAIKKMKIENPIEINNQKTGERRRRGGDFGKDSFFRCLSLVFTETLFD